MVLFLIWERKTESLFYQENFSLRRGRINSLFLKLLINVYHLLPPATLPASVLAVCNSNSTQLRRDHLHNWFTVKPRLRHIAPNQRQFLSSPPTYNFWEKKNKFKLLSETAAQELYKGSLFWKVRPNYPAFLPYMCVQMLFTGHLEMEGWCVFVHTSLHLDVVLFVWVKKSFPNYYNTVL